MHLQYLVSLSINLLYIFSRKDENALLVLIILMDDLILAGAYDLIQQPKNISEASKKNVCFFMFIDEQTQKFLKNSSDLNDNKKIGLWKIIVVHNLPYTDPRRNGKVIIIKKKKTFSILWVPSMMYV